MRCLGIAVAFGSMLVLNAAAQADEPAAKLPEDGWWARYFLIEKVTLPDDRVREQTAQVTISLTGTTTEKNEKCRWIESRSVYRPAELDEQLTGVMKLLVPEKDLVESNRPVERTVRGWHKNEGSVFKEKSGLVIPARISPPDAPAVGSVNHNPSLFPIFPGTRRKAEAVDLLKTIDYQQGRLAISQALTGQIKGRTVPYAPPVLRSKTMTTDSEFTIWVDPAVDPGFAAAKFVRSTRDDDAVRNKTTVDWIIEDLGTGAKSNLPENN